MKLGRYIVGLISGLTFGMLFAPKKGKKLREEILKKGSTSGQEALSALFTAFRDAGTDAVGEMRKLSENEQIRAALNMSKDKMNEYLAQIEDKGYGVAASAQEKLEEISDFAVKNASAFKQRTLKRRVRPVKRKAKAVVSKAKKAVAKKTVAKKATTKSPKKRRATTKKSK